MQKELQKKEGKLGFIILCVLIAALIPLYIVAGYAHPSVDDYSYGKYTAEVWNETGSFGEVLADAWERTAYTYETHQGTFSSVFLMRLQPGIFGEEYYFLTTVFLLGTFIICSILLYYAFFNRIFQAGKVRSWIIAGILSLGAMEFTHVISDSFYWYNGGVTYTFFYSMEALLFALLIYMYTAKKQFFRVLLGIACILLAVFVCGGNYVTSLVTLELLVCICLVTGVSVYRRKKEENAEELKSLRWNFLFCLLVLLAAAVCFIVVVIAPGNAVRQEKTGETTNPIISILLSFTYGAYSIGNCMNLPALLLLFLCVPLFVVIARKSSVAFKYPGLISFFSFCLYSSQATPVFFAQGIKMPYRIMNIIYFSCFVIAAFNLFYWIGYIVKKKPQSMVLSTLESWHEKKFWLFYAVAALGVCFSVAGNISIKAEMDMEGAAQVEVTELPATLSACYSLLTGEAKKYDKECWDRFAVYTDPEFQDVVVKPFTVTPEIIFHSDITEDPEHWKNECVRKFFNKKSVKIK